MTILTTTITQTRSIQKNHVCEYGKYSRQLQSFFELGSRHEKRVEHRHTLREHCDLQLVFILRIAEGKKIYKILNSTIMRNYQ